MKQNFFYFSYFGQRAEKSKYSHSCIAGLACIETLKFTDQPSSASWSGWLKGMNLLRLRNFLPTYL